MNDKITTMQKALRQPKKDWKKQNFLNMIALYQHELIQEGLNDIWGNNTGFSYSTNSGFDEVLNFVPPVQNSVGPLVNYDTEPQQSSFNKFEEQNGSYNSNYEEFQFDQYVDSYSSAESQGPLVYDTPRSGSMYSGPYDISFLNKYARFLLPTSFVCTVQFKYACRDYSITDYLMSTQTIEIGTILVVRSHVDIRQIDMGVVVRLYTVEEYKEFKSYVGKSVDPDENFVGQVLRVAFKKDTKKLTLKHTTEATILPIAQNLVIVHQLPISVYGVEFQYDGFNLFVYYTRKNVGQGTNEGEEKLDFKPYIYDLIVDCPHTRIIMKDTTNSRPFAPDPMAEKKLKKL